METFADIEFNPIFEEYCNGLERFINEEFEFEIYWSGGETSINETPIKTIAHLRNFIKMFPRKYS